MAFDLLRASHRAADLVTREDAAREALRRVCRAQTDYRERTGRYGWIRDLEAAGLLPDVRVAADGGASHVSTPGYRVDVLLPCAQGLCLPRPGIAPDAERAQRHFAAVARPLEPGRTGHRTWYLDERDELFFHEGVLEQPYDLDDLLPRNQVRRSSRLDTTSELLWQREAE